jgi:hypothetical protein
MDRDVTGQAVQSPEPALTAADTSVPAYERAAQPGRQFDATGFHFPRNEAMSLDDIFDGPEYASRWATRSAYERWCQHLPSEVEAYPPEHARYHGLEDTYGPFNPARFVGREADKGFDAGDLDDDAIGHRMWTAIGRLFGCLHVDGHPDAPHVVLVPTPIGAVYYFASAADVHKFARLIQVAADAVLNHEWADQIEPDETVISRRDERMLTIAESLLATMDAGAMADWGYLVAPEVKAMWDRANEDEAYLRRMVIYADDPRGTHDPHDPARVIPWADVAAALGYQRRRGLLETAPWNMVWRSTTDPLDAWELMSFGDEHLLEDALAREYPGLDVTDLFADRLRRVILDVEGLREALNTAWRLLALNPVSLDNPHPHPAWPAIRERGFPVQDGAPAHFVWQIASLADARRMLDLLARVTRRTHMHAIRRSRRARAWESEFPVPMYWLTRKAAEFPHLPDAAALDLVGAYTPARRASHPGITGPNDEPLVPPAIAGDPG